MTGADIFEAVGDLDDKFITEADPTKRISVSKHKYIKILAVAASLLLMIAAAYGYIVTDYDYLVSKSDIGDGHIPEYPDYAYGNILGFCALEKQPSVVSVEALCRDDSKFLAEFIVTGEVMEKTVNGEMHYFLPVIFDDPVFLGSKVDINVRFVRTVNVDYMYNRFSHLENMPEGARFLAFVSDVDDSNTPILAQNIFYIDSNERLVPMFMPATYFYGSSGKPTIMMYKGFNVEVFKKIALAFYNDEQEKWK